MSTWTVISSLDAPTGGVFDFPSLSLGSYSAVQVIGSGITVTTDGTDVVLRVYQSGSEVTSISYRWGMHLDSSAGSGNTDADNGATALYVVSDDSSWDVGNASNEGIGFIATFDSPASTALGKRVRFESAFTNASGSLIAAEGVGVQAGTAAIGGFKVLGSSSLTAGKVRILGLA